MPTCVFADPCQADVSLDDQRCGRPERAAKGVPNYNAEKCNFALDEIYPAKGPVTVNGVTVDPPRNDKPTLLVPTDSKEAMTTVKTMTINSPAVGLGLSCGKNPADFAPAACR